jgi:hypothetical protein
LAAQEIVTLREEQILELVVAAALAQALVLVVLELWF